MTMRRNLLLSVAATGLLAMTACQPIPTTTQVEPSFGARADINPGYQPGQLNLPDKKIPTLSEMESITPVDTADKGAAPKDKLRVPALRNAALSYGAIGGLAWGSKQINTQLEADAGNLSRTYDFNSLLIRPEGGVTILPPVISESSDTYEQADAGNTLRVADKYYEILSQARFAPTAPLWHTYLIRVFAVPPRPNEELLPKTAGERQMWRAYVDEGWSKGLDQAKQTFKIDLRRLERDYTGMIRYSALYDQHMVSSPVVADQNLGVTGTGMNMRQNDRLFRITAPPRLNVQDPSSYSAPVSGIDPSQAGTPPGSPTGQLDN
jgi:defect-in-organelle-trafficking protein DotC